MAQFEVQPDAQRIGEAAAAKAVEALNQAIETHGTAVWVLAGGTAPMIAYNVLATQYQDAVDWSKVIVLIGDERCVPLDDPDSNWHQIASIFLNKIPIPEANKLRPKSDLSAEEAAADYEKVLAQLPQTKTGLPRFDIVWLGMGEDGHTLSLFPHHPGLQNTQPLVIPIHDSPKPPSNRITLTLKALQTTTSCIIMTSGAGKIEAIKKARENDSQLPIARAVRAIESRGGNVTWLVDPAAFEDHLKVTDIQ
jgi:6-phosphogluconolactonase